MTEGVFGRDRLVVQIVGGRKIPVVAHSRRFFRYALDIVAVQGTLPHDLDCILVAGNENGHLHFPDVVRCLRRELQREVELLSPHPQFELEVLIWDETGLRKEGRVLKIRPKPNNAIPPR